MTSKVDQARDSLATDMMSFLAKDAELGGLFAKFLNFNLEFHSFIAEQVRLTQPKVETILWFQRGFPIFGSSLSSYLASFPLPSGIATPYIWVSPGWSCWAWRKSGSSGWLLDLAEAESRARGWHGIPTQPL